jgi:hypothetical protein
MSETPIEPPIPDDAPVKLTGEQLAKIITLSHRIGFNNGRQSTVQYLEYFQHVFTRKQEIEDYFTNRMALSLQAISQSIKENLPDGMD